MKCSNVLATGCQYSGMMFGDRNVLFLCCNFLDFHTLMTMEEQHIEGWGPGNKKQC